MKRQGVTIGGETMGKSVMEVLQAQGVYLLAPCGGKGTCGKCRVRFLTEAPAPSYADRKVLAKEEIAAGIRLACRAPAEEGMIVEVIAPDESGMEAADSFALPAPGGAVASISGSPFSDTGIFSGTSDTGTGLPVSDPEEAGSEPARPGQIAAAVDIGTTTIAMSAVDTGTGRILQTVTGINHQRALGADVISRIEASNEGKGEVLQQSILSDLASLRDRLGLDETAPMIISGNTTMEHLLQGLSCRTLGVAPYTPVDISLHTYENNASGNNTSGSMIILPGISTYVGADIVSGIVACGMDRSEEICVLVDLGTNGEMAVGNRDRIITASTAAGPAFEGGNISCGVAGIPGAVSSVVIEDGKPRITTIGDLPPAGLCGTGVLEVVYELLVNGLMDETGLLEDEYFEDGFPVANGVVFTAKDVREVQLAKSAVRAGLEVLLREYGADYRDVGKVYLAGGFGQKIDLTKAVGIGLMPEEMLDRMVPVGNSSLAGAVMAAVDPKVLRRMEETAQKAEETALAENPLFSDLYMEHMFFPEQ